MAGLNKPLATIGNSKVVHSLMPNGKTHCWRRFENDPDAAWELANVLPLNKSGLPTCKYCRSKLGL
jgi:hypothetical protein